jgi:eukaryotic-like serine/threonine-protein kinase
VVIEAGALGERYTIVERIAVGGMGAVYRATDNRLNRTVAVKLLKEGLAHDPRFVERFRREARSAAGLTHPNIAGVFDYGEEHGQHFIVMELADGRDLARVLLDEGPLPVDRALKIAAATADALGHAHHMGVIHRDVKPANILVDAHDRVKVTDFGIARAAGDSTITQTGTILGTAFYLSPEQASGDNLGPHSDVYSLGVVLYEMLTGAVPFTADSPVSVAMKHLNEEVPSPSWLKPGIASDVDELVRAATAKDPKDRPADGAEFAARVRRVIGAPATDAAPAAAAVTAAEETPVAAVTAPVGTTSEPSASDTWVLPGPRLPWQRLIALTLAGLAGLAVLMLAIAALTGDEGGRRAAGARDGSNQEDAAPPADEEEAPVEEEPTEEVDVPALSIPSDVVGQDAKDVERALKELGVNVEKVPVESDEFEKHLVVDTAPPPGSEVQPGETVTLYESKGSSKGNEHEEDD